MVNSLNEYKVKRLRKIANKLFLVCFFGILSFQSKSLHIIGGDIYYECLGNDQYRITMKVYRDCFSSGAAFDDPAFMTIYSGNNLNINNPYADLEVPLSSQSGIPPDLDNPCLIPPSNVCVEEGIYSTVVTLPFNQAGYHISYQRCCRNTTINNITTPDDVGATYTIFISGQSLTECNSSPEFNEFPPIVICANEPIDFDHSATDPEGDELTYRLCAPLIGGGVLGVDPNDPAGSQNWPNGVVPNPATPPPYNNVNYVVGPFSFAQPLGFAANMQINGTTGFLTGIPVNVGQFVVGICVEERRNGVLLSTIRRDFQFNVTNCERTILADIREDFMIGPKEFVINSCGTNTVVFDNQSTQAQFIDGYYWEFDLENGTSATSLLENPTITFPGIGEYQGILVVNPNSPNCSDTADIFVNVFPDITSQFSFSFDPCDPSPITYTDESFTGGGFITNWDWDFGEGGTSTEQNPTYLFTEAGSWPVSLTVTDDNNCIETLTQTVDWFPESTILIAPEEDRGCSPFTVTIQNNSFPLDGYTTTWDLGDGTSSSEASPTHTYEEPGTYTVSIRIESPIGCVSEQTFPDLITVDPSPNAVFTCTPDDPSIFKPEVTFIDQSTDANVWLWDFGTGATSNATNPTYTFPDTGIFEVDLIVTHISGCQDSTSKLVDIEPKFTYFLPNAFTPNFDETNDVFRGEGIFYGIEVFEMTIWNRWGELVFKTNNPNEAWNGRKNNTGRMSPAGVYVYLVNITGARNKSFEYKGFATIVR